MRRGPVLAVGAFLSVGIVAIAQAASIPTARLAPRSELDVRSTSQVRVPLTAQQQHALQTMRGITVRMNDVTGSPASVIRYGGALTPPSTARPAAIAAEYLAHHAGLFRLRSADLADFRVAAGFVTETNGATQLTLQQLDQGRRIEGARLTFVIDRRVRIASVSGASYPDIAAEATPSLSAAEAVQVAASALGLDENRPLTLISASTGP